MISEYLRWLKYWVADKKARGFYETGPMKTKGFTLVELVVAVTLIVILTSMATTSIYDVVHTMINIRNINQNIENMIGVRTAVAQAKMDYATDLAITLAAEVAAAPSPTPSGFTPPAQAAIQQWNQLVSQNDDSALIALLITPVTPDPSSPSFPLNRPAGSSYLPTSHTATVTNGSVIESFTTPITNMDSLLRAFVLTDNGQPYGNPIGNVIATVSVGPMLDLNAGVRPTLPVVAWKPGTLQMLQF